MNLRTKYRMLKATTIAIGALSIPWGTFIGYSFGAGRYSTGVVALMRSGGDITDRWLHLVLGAGEHEGQDGERAGGLRPGKVTQ